MSEIKIKPLCIFCDRYTGFRPCSTKINKKQCDDSNNWEHFERKLVMVYEPCIHCKQHTICTVSSKCNQNSKWPYFEKRDDYEDNNLHDDDPPK